MFHVEHAKTSVSLAFHVKRYNGLSISQPVLTSTHREQDDSDRQPKGWRRQNHHHNQSCRIARGK